MASKKASASSPVRVRIASASAGEVRGPVATMTLSQSSGGSAATSARRMVIKGSAASAALDRGGEAVPVDGERAARRHAMRVGGAHDERAATPHLLVQQADGVVLGVVRAEGIGADELGEAVGDMRRGAAVRPHLHEHHRDAGARELPRRLASGEAAADDMNGRGRLHQG